MNNITPKWNKNQELMTCKVLVTETNIEAKYPIESSNITFQSNFVNKTTNKSLAISKDSIESRDIAYVPKFAKNNKKTSVTKHKYIS